jgi:hypothetical protein
LKAKRKKAKGLWKLVAAAIACALLLVALPGSAAAKKPRSLYWGATIGEQITGTAAPWDMTPVKELESVTGKGLSLISFSSTFADCNVSPCFYFRFPADEFDNIREYGAIPFYSWGSQSMPSVLDQPDFQLSDLISGRYDTFIRNWALGAKDWGHPFFLRFDPEMNGFWFSWSEGVNGNQPGEFATAWRHVHDIFTSVGANNATWVWCPNVDTTGHLRDLRSLYPGDSYVDWTCLDGFNWGERRGSPGWYSFSKIYHSTYRLITSKIAPSKPMVIGEIASSDRGGSKATWIKNMLNLVRNRYRKIRGLIWYDVNDRGTHWPLETSSGKAKRAFRAGIRSGAFRPNVYGNLGTGRPVPPPSR